MPGQLSSITACSNTAHFIRWAVAQPSSSTHFLQTPRWQKCILLSSALPHTTHPCSSSLGLHLHCRSMLPTLINLSSYSQGRVAPATSPRGLSLVLTGALPLGACRSTRGLFPWVSGMLHRSALSPEHQPTLSHFVSPNKVPLSFTSTFIAYIHI